MCIYSANCKERSIFPIFLHSVADSVAANLVKSWIMKIVSENESFVFSILQVPRVFGEKYWKIQSHKSNKECLYYGCNSLIVTTINLQYSPHYIFNIYIKNKTIHHSRQHKCKIWYQTRIMTIFPLFHIFSLCK